MTTIDSYGIGAVLAIGVAFYFVRKVPWYIALCVVIVGVVASATRSELFAERACEWVVLTLGLASCSFGLLIVRVMLVRSVSLQLLGDIAEARQGAGAERLGGRLDDMRAFHLIRTTGDARTLTDFGKVVGAIVAVFYRIFGVAR